MTRLLLLTAVGVLTAAAASAQTAAIDKGQKVYAAQKCSICHSVAGVGNKRGSLDGLGARMSADDIRLWITNAPDMTAKAKAERKPPMKAYTLPKDELDALVSYLQSLK